MTALCPICHLPDSSGCHTHPSLLPTERANVCLGAQQEATEALLRNIGDRGICSGCSVRPERAEPLYLVPEGGPILNQKEGVLKMGQSITFRGSSIRYFDVRQGKEGGDVLCRVHMSASWSEQVRDNMEWEPIPDSITEAKLSGELLASYMILTPGDKQLKQHELQFDISSVEDFRIVSLKDDEGEVRGRELRFVVRTPQAAEGFLGQYMRLVGRHEGALKVSYVKQETLDLSDTKGANPETKDTDSETKDTDSETDELNTGCVSCNNRLPFEDAGKTVHANGAKCTREAGAGAVASAVEAAGGTTDALRKGRGRPRREAAPVAAPTAEERAQLDEMAEAQQVN